MRPFLKPFWRYYGAKWRAAPRYPSPNFDTVIEPFAGAAGYSLRHYKKKVILVEKYHVIAEIWRYLIRTPADEIRSIPTVNHVDDLPPWTPQGAKWLVGFNMNSATSSPCKQTSSGILKYRSRSPNAIGGWTARMRERVASQVDFIRHWKIIEGEYFYAPDIQATWFIDPPYKNHAGSLYVHSELNYNVLGSWCKERKGQPIVCENQGATWLPFRYFATIKASPMANKSGVSHEVIWDGQQHKMPWETP